MAWSELGARAGYGKGFVRERAARGRISLFVQPVETAESSWGMRLSKRGARLSARGGRSPLAEGRRVPAVEPVSATSCRIPPPVLVRGSGCEARGSGPWFLLFGFGFRPSDFGLRFGAKTPASPDLQLRNAKCRLRNWCEVRLSWYRECGCRPSTFQMERGRPRPRPRGRVARGAAPARSSGPLRPARCLHEIEMRPGASGLCSRAGRG